MKNQKKVKDASIDTRTVLLKAVAETYGLRGEISRKELNAMVKTLGTPYPTWFVSDKSRKIRWGVFAVNPTVEVSSTAVNPTVSPKTTSPKI